jgi:superfamily II DNA or RNA helicase
MRPLRPYQLEAIEAARVQLRSNKSTMIVVATGGGKSIIMARMAEAAAAKGNKVLVIAHRRRLIEQIAQTLAADGFHPGVEMGKERATMLNDVVVGSVGSMAKRLSRFAPDHFKLILVDECHHYAKGPWLRPINHFPNAKVIGVTATPNRGDRLGLEKTFATVAYEIGMLELVNMGFLSPIVVESAPLNIDINSVHVGRDGDFDENELDSTIRPHLAKAAEMLKEKAGNRRTLAFLPLIVTARDFAEECRKVGLRADYVSGKCKDQAEKIKRFEDGELDVLANSQLLTEGVDLPCTDCIFPLRPIKSTTLYTQAIGRGTRLYPGKENCLLLDPLFLHENHDIMRPANLIGEDADEIEIIEEKLAEGMTLSEAKREAADEHERRLKVNREEQEKREQSLAAAMAKQTGKLYRLKSLADLAPILGWAVAKHVDRYDWQREEPTSAQLEFLRKHGYPIQLATSKGAAASIIKAINDRSEKRLATLKQVQFMESKGVPRAGSVSFDAARSIIDGLKGNKQEVEQAI